MDKPSMIATIGVDDCGKEVTRDFERINNILVSGTVGSGKTNFAKNIILSLAENNRPRGFKLIVFDSKGVDYSDFSYTDFLYVPIITNGDRVAAALNWAVAEMKEREKKFYIEGKYDIASFNDEMTLMGKAEECIPHILIVLDDFAEVSHIPSVIDSVKTLLKGGRRTGIHIVIVTSTPTSSVINTELNGLIYCRISFATVNSKYSRMILGVDGAEELEYPGGMIFKNLGDIVACKTVVHSNFRDKLNQMNNPAMDRKNREAALEILERLERSVISEPLDKSESDELLNDAIDFILDLGKVSVSLLQRRFRIGYNRAARLIDIMEEMGIISLQDCTPYRTLVMTKDQVKAMMIPEVENTSIKDSHKIKD